MEEEGGFILQNLYTILFWPLSPRGNKNIQVIQPGALTYSAEGGRTAAAKPSPRSWVVLRLEGQSSCGQIFSTLWLLQQDLWPQTFSSTKLRQVCCLLSALPHSECLKVLLQGWQEEEPQGAEPQLHRLCAAVRA